MMADIGNVGDQIHGLPYAQDETDIHDDMAAFDSFPREIRQALSSAPLDICAEPVAWHFQSGMSPALILREIEALNAEVLKAAYSEKGIN
ncbi:hypothetical protein G8E10_09470 [Rhizobiaceae bacterium CRRU44]|uniref:Uncharacterized protein n=1 Tax=Ferranicluibacter rubi TaxID=2715133 RepID=A0AA43ZFB9_9HYPH|nr:hypothetical protein [Ferranicluibacter rubi]NHT75908.1 hypothetical protein [Ferranicluibacter rubi]NHT75968.1 hypothetical protein [Ferranicluibacter rubi]